MKVNSIETNYRSPEQIEVTRGYYQPDNPKPLVRYIIVKTIPEPSNYNVGFKGSQDDSSRLHLIG